MSINSKRLRMANLPYHIMLGLSTAALTSTTVVAQTDDDATTDDEDEMILEEVIVTGMRNSLMSSQDMKRDADVVVDAITADDIGALPDRSVLEALQRVPGVAISRFAGTSDPDHFSVEGSGTVVRGLNFVRSELNGRDIFTADQGQALGFSTVTPELMGAVQVFKNQSADMVEGGIGGTVNLVTRKPLDKEGSVFAWSLEAMYGDMMEKWTPGVSALWAHNWETKSGGRLGVLVSAAYNRLKSRSDGTLIADWLDRDGSGRYVPTGAGIRTQEYDRKRTGISAALQWQNQDGDKEATLEYFRSTYDNSWGENVIEPSPDAVPVITPRPGTEFTFDDNGLFESGIISENVGWRGNADQYGVDHWNLNGARNIVQKRNQDSESTTQDIAFNYKWVVNDRWSTNFDAQYIDSEVDVYDISVQGAIFADTLLDMKGDVPTVIYLPPTGGSEDFMQDPYNHYIRSIMDHETDNEGNEWALRADAEYDFEDDGWARSIRFGARYTDREQTVDRSTYNWGNVSDTWNTPFFLDDPTLPDGIFNPYTFEDYQRGNDGAVNIPIYDGPMDQASLTQLTELAGNGGWQPLYERDGVVPGTSYLPGESNKTKQTTSAIYARFDFGWEFSGGMYLDGNVGVRYVKTDVTANGGIVYPNFQDFLGGETLEQRCTPEQGGSIPGFCLEDPATQASYAAWADGSSDLISDKYDYSNTLPSLNLRWGLNDDHIIRFAYSKAISRPDFGLLKSNFPIVMGGDNPTTGEWLGPQSDAAQVRIDPITSNQYDLSWEWYFADVGSVTVTGFYKTLDDYIVPGVAPRSFINNGQDWDVNVVGSTNNDGDSGDVKGVEFAYQQVFDMLPGLWSGLGVQGNYTYIDSNGVPNVSADNGTDSGLPEGVPTVDVSGLGLPGLSKHTYNAVLFWESDKIATRLAYNYRSEYTLTTRDVIYPYTPIIHSPTGQLDFSFFYTFNDYLKIGFQAVNLTDEVTKTKTVINEAYDQAGRSYFRNDRRYSIVLRGTF